MYLGVATLLLLSLSLFALGTIRGAMLVVEHIAQLNEAKTRVGNDSCVSGPQNIM